MPHALERVTADRQMTTPEAPPVLPKPLEDTEPEVSRTGSQETEPTAELAPAPVPSPAERDPLRFLGGVVLLGAALAAVLWVWKAPVDVRTSSTEALPIGSRASVTVALPEVAPPPPPRCSRVGTQSYRIGNKQAEQAATAGTPEADDDEDNDELPAAFGAEISRAIALPSGFAVGVRHDNGLGTHAAVATLTRDATGGSLIDLGLLRGDGDAPLLAPLGGGWLAGMLEPAATGATLRIAVSRANEEPKWSVDIDQGSDESLAFDLAPGPKSVVVAWDEVTADGKLSRVLWSTLTPDGSKIARAKVLASRPGIDADTPRVVARPSGFWLAYIARKALDVPKTEESKPLERAPKVDDDAGEKILPSWLELLPIDEAGVAVGPARAVTPKSGHALTFDLASTSDGAALLVWRDDDTPLGSHGGRVNLMSVLPSGSSEAQLLAENDVGSGSPTLLTGWVAITNAAGRAMLAPLAPNGAITGELRIEPAIGTAEPLFAVDARVLTATSVGSAIELGIVDCKP